MASREDIADHLFITGAQVGVLVKKNFLPQPRGRAGYDMDECRKRYLEYLRGRIRNRVEDVNGTPQVNQQDERALLLRQQRIMQEMKNAEMQGKMVNTDEVIQCNEAVAIIYRVTLMNAASRLVSIMGLHGSAAAKMLSELKKEIALVLWEVSEKLGKLAHAKGL